MQAIPFLDRKWVRRAFLLVCATAYLLVAVRSAWMCDDAYITFRTVDNFINGFGLTWNVVERVQVYTHPLWMFLTAAVYSVTREAYFTGLAVSLISAAAAFCLLLFRIASSTRRALVAGTILIVSKAFVDYTTSGLENPLSFLLLAWFLFLLGRGTVFRLSLCASLIALNRLDLLALVFPSYLWELRTILRGDPGTRRTAVAELVAGWLPLIAWEVFSLVYYGFPFPNTAYAKLKTGIALGPYLQSGFAYLARSLALDPVTLLAIAGALVLLFASARSAERAAACGVLLYTAYLVRIGGDFMSGRLLTAPLFWCVAAVAGSRGREWPLRIGGLVLVMAGVFNPLGPLRSGADYPPGGTPMPGDERGVYYPATGLLRARSLSRMPDHEWFRQGLALREEMEKRGEYLTPLRAIGFYGFAAGPGLHGVDVMGLADPLLGRLDAQAAGAGTCPVGHFERAIPAGYLEAIIGEPAALRDPGVAEYYRKLRIITRGPLFGARRFGVIGRMNTGQYEHLLRAAQKAQTHENTGDFSASGSSR